NVVQPTSTLTIDKQMTATGGVAIQKVGAGAAEVKNIRAASLAVNEGELRVLNSGSTTGVSNVSSLTVAAGAKLNLTNNAAVVNYTGSSPLGSWNGSAYTGLIGNVQSGYNNGTWTGNG